MKRTRCRLTLVDKAYGGGQGGGSLGSQIEGKGAVPFGTIQYRDPKYEQGVINQYYGNQEQQYAKGVQNNPLFNAAQGQALNFNQQFPDLMKQLSGYQSQLSGYQGQLGNFSEQLNPALAQVSGITAGGGAPTPEQARNATQMARVQAPTGSLLNAGSVAREALGREDVRRSNFNTALQQEQGILGQQGGFASAGAGITGQRAGITGQTQNMQTNLLNQLSGTANQAISGLSQEFDPALQFLGNLFAGNQNASVQGAGIAQKANEAGSSKMAGGISGIASVLGAVVAGL